MISDLPSLQLTRIMLIFIPKTYDTKTQVTFSMPDNTRSGFKTKGWSVMK
jgi:hypothetical protein